MRKEEIDSNNIFVIHDFLSAEECDHFIRVTEEAGYGDAPISTGAGFAIRKDVRNNDRVMIDDVPLAQQIWDRAREFIPPIHGRWEAIGLNERFRYYRYDVGQRFAIHTDGCFERDNGERSHLTFMVYLNDGFGGGETVFQLRRDGKQIIWPIRGMALVFNHSLLHEGAMVEKGRKYVLRTDVMYRFAKER
jgi:predicted 2-oxoglutarate/Fe(II)-dependent dioxygenase YbiX